MGRLAHRTTSFLRRHAGLKPAAHFMLDRVPDVRVTRNIKGIGPVRYRLRRHHYFWTRPPLNDGPLRGLLRHIVHPGDIVYDIGANIGLYSRIMLQWCEAEKVFAFEPMTENVELLNANARLAPDPSKIVAFPTALGERNGFEELQIDDISSGSAVLDVVSGGQPAKFRRLRNLPPLTERIPIWRLDDLNEQEKLPLPTMMKIDVEGAAAMVLRGAVRTLETSSPRLFIALHGDSEAKPVLELILSMGYHCYDWIDRDGQRIFTRLELSDVPYLLRHDICCSKIESEVNTPPKR